MVESIIISNFFFIAESKKLKQAIKALRSQVKIVTMLRDQINVKKSTFSGEYYTSFALSILTHDWQFKTLN